MINVFSDEDLLDPPTVPLRSEMPTNYHYDRRRSRAVLYQLSGQFDKHTRANRTKSKLQKLNTVNQYFNTSILEMALNTMNQPSLLSALCAFSDSCFGLGRFIVYNAIFNNISVISWRSVLLVKETGLPGENHRPVASH